MLRLLFPRSGKRRFERLRRGLVTTLVAMAMLRASGAAQDRGVAAAIRAVLDQQAADWNRGDLDAFASGYKHSPDILFMGKSVAHGYDGMLQSYKAHYPSPESRGTLTFSSLDIQPLDERFATATGNFHLQRTPKGGGDASGYFLLVLEKTGGGWKIVRDDTTATEPTPHSSNPT